MSSVGHNGGPLSDGWIARHRSVREHWLVGHGIHVKPADPDRKRCHTQGEAWEDLLMECRYEAGFVSNGGKKMELRRGELVGAASWLGHRWNWTPKTVRRFLDQLENDEMIVQKTPGTIGDGTQKGKQATVLSVCNYDTYQYGYTQQGQAEGKQRERKGQAEGMQGESKGQAEGNIYKDNKGTKEQGKKDSPLPPTGGDGGLFAGIPAEEPKSSRITAEVTEACEIYNTAAKHFQFSVCESFTDARRKRVQKRLEDLGGIENFKAALRALGRSDPFVSFLRGKAPARPGEQPFRLDIDRLMQTNGNLGDVLAKLFDISRSAHAAPTATPVDVQASRQALRVKIAAMSDDQQRELLAAKANGIWPVQDLADPPIEPACAFRPHVLASLGISDGTYDRNGFKRR